MIMFVNVEEREELLLKDSFVDFYKNLRAQSQMNK